MLASRYSDCCLKWWNLYCTEIFQQKSTNMWNNYLCNITIIYHGLPVSIYRGCTMVYPGKMHGWPVSKYHGIPYVLPWFTIQNTMVYHAFYHGLPVSKYHGILWYTLRFTMVYQFQNTMVDHGIPCVLPWYTMAFTMVYQFQNIMVYHDTIYHGTNTPWYNYTMV